MPYVSRHGGRHELGQNYLHHRPTIDRFVDIVAKTKGGILEVGAGDGALTRPLSVLGRDLVAIEIDEHRVRKLRRCLPDVTIRQADVMDVPLVSPVIVGNVPFHLTTPILRRILHSEAWSDVILLTQWEVARKRAGVGRRTMLTAQADPWFEFSLQGRVPAHAFRPRPGVDGGLLMIHRRESPLLPKSQRRAYDVFVRRVFTGRGRTAREALAHAVPGLSARGVASILGKAGVQAAALTGDLRPEQWVAVWNSIRIDPQPLTRAGHQRTTPRSLNRPRHTIKFEEGERS